MKSAFGIDYRPSGTTSNKVSKLDARTQYELLLYDFIQENFYKYPYKHFVRATKFVNLVNESFCDYCLLITSNMYTITAIKTKVDSLPDNNSLIPATYHCAILNKNCKVIDKLGNIASKKVYGLFATGNFR